MLSHLYLLKHLNNLQKYLMKVVVFMDDMLNIVYSKKNFVIYRLSSHSFLVHNTRKDIGTGTTSLKKLSVAKDMANWALYQQIPTKHLSGYLLRGLIRISDSKEYTEQIKSILKSQT